VREVKKCDESITGAIFQRYKICIKPRENVLDKITVYL